MGVGCGRGIWRGVEGWGRHGQSAWLEAERRSLRRRPACSAPWIRVMAAKSCGGSFVLARGGGVLRWGEAENPGPPMQGRVGEGAETSAVDEAWERVRNDPTWVPAWKTWAQQVVVGTEGGRPRIELRRTQWNMEDGEEVQEEHEWQEEELECFLQQCEVDAGWREGVDLAQSEQLARAWRDWEAEVTMAGIQGPRLEESGRQAGAEQGQVEVEVMELPAVGGARQARGAAGKERGRPEGDGGHRT